MTHSGGYVLRGRFQSMAIQRHIVTNLSQLHTSHLIAVTCCARTENEPSRQMSVAEVTVFSICVTYGRLGLHVMEPMKVMYVHDYLALA
jgi:hypothetical protein